jgi:hypothetical protein
MGRRNRGASLYRCNALLQRLEISTPIALHPTHLEQNEADREGRQEYHQGSDQHHPHALAVCQGRDLSTLGCEGSMHLSDGSLPLLIDRRNAFNQRAVHRFKLRAGSSLGNRSIRIGQKRAVARSISVKKPGQVQRTLGVRIIRMSHQLCSLKP